VFREIDLDLLYLSPFRGKQPLPEIFPQDIESARHYGILQPVIARPSIEKRSGAGRYEILTQEKSWLVAQRAALAKVPVWVRTDLDDDEARNLVRQSSTDEGAINPIHDAHFLKNILASESRLSKAALGRRLGRSRSSVSNTLRLLELDSQVQRLVETKQLDEGHARPLLGLPPAEQRQLAQYFIQRKLTVRAAEQLVRNKKSDESHPVHSPQSDSRDAAVVYLEEHLGELLGASVEITHTQLKINHSGDIDILDGLLDKGGYTARTDIVHAILVQQMSFEPRHLVFNYHGDLDVLQEILERFGYQE